MAIQKKVFGNIQGQTVYIYQLSNKNGMEVKIMNYGATITSVTIPDPKKGRINLVCGFDTLEGYFSEDYKANAPYFGCTVGRYAGTMKDARFSVGGKEYQLAKNIDPHHLHGGNAGFDKQIWDSEEYQLNGQDGVKMSYRSPHLEEGYPGNLEVELGFLLSESNMIEIGYRATTDQETPLSLTNHSYFNLNGFDDQILKHRVSLDSPSYLKAGDSGVPEGEIQSVEHAITDLRNGLELKKAFEKLEGGFEHYYIFEKPPGELKTIADIIDPESGRSLKVATTEPGMLLYTGKYTADNLMRENGDQFGQYRAFCCETSRYINGPNIPESPASTLPPGDTYTSKTTFTIKF